MPRPSFCPPRAQRQQHRRRPASENAAARPPPSLMAATHGHLRKQQAFARGVVFGVMSCAQVTLTHVCCAKIHFFLDVFFCFFQLPKKFASDLFAAGATTRRGMADTAGSRRPAGQLSPAPGHLLGGGPGLRAAPAAFFLAPRCGGLCATVPRQRAVRSRGSRGAAACLSAAHCECAGDVRQPCVCAVPPSTPVLTPSLNLF